MYLLCIGYIGHIWGRFRNQTEEYPHFPISQSGWSTRVVCCFKIVADLGVGSMVLITIHVTWFSRNMYHE